MARTFNGTTQYLIGAAPAVPSAFSFACWINPTNAVIGTSQVVLALSNLADNLYSQLYIGNNGAGAEAVLFQESGASTSDNAISAGGVIVNGSWFHVGGVHLSASSRKVYLNGTATSNTTNVGAITTPTKLTAGVLTDLAATTGFFAGAIAEIGVWNVALAQSDFTALAAGVAPALIKPESLVSYVRVLGYSPEADYLRATGGLTVTAAPTVSAHPTALCGFGRSKMTREPFVSIPVVPLPPPVLPATTQWLLHRVELRRRPEEN